MNPVYLDYAEAAFTLMALFGLVLTPQEALDQAAKKISGKYPEPLIAAARAEVEAQLTGFASVRHAN